MPRPQTYTMPTHLLTRVAAVGLLAATCLVGNGCSGQADTPAAPARRALEFPVEVAPVAERRVEYVIGAVGSVEAFERVQVTARVAGVVERVRFSEGEVVQPAQTLVEIEPDRYRLAVEAAAARLQRVQAEFRDAQAGLARRQGLQGSGLVADEDVETWHTRVAVTEASVAEAQAAQRQAELNLRDAMVQSPFAGVIQTRTVETGQFVQAGTVMAELVRREPLLLRFGVPESDARRVVLGTRVRFVALGSPREYTAAISHVTGYAEPTTRMVAVTAQIDDTERGQLRPGAFAQVTVPIEIRDAATVIPQGAVRPSERGFIAFIVEGEIAHERALELGMRTPEGEVEVLSGLEPGESLVVRGAEALRDGARVRVAAAAAGDGAADGAGVGVNN